MPTENADIIHDTPGDDVIGALGGDDEIHVSAGNDLVGGGHGVDILFLDYGYLTSPLVDHVVAGYDFAFRSAGGPSVGYRAVERVVITAGSGDDDITTGATEDRLLLGAGSDSAASGAGNDHLDGGSGSDSLTGGAGNDAYIVDQSGDMVFEAAAGGSDRVESSATFTLPAEVETLVLTGLAAIDGTGNALANSLIGNNAANRLDGGGGVDTMKGGLGNDVYLVDSLGDVVQEALGGGIDEIRTNLPSYSIAHNGAIERLVGTSDSGQTLTGSALHSLIIAGAGNDILVSGAGTAALHGGAGNDIYRADSRDVIVEKAGEGTDEVRAFGLWYALEANVEILTGLATNYGQQLIGNAIANTIAGNVNNDTLEGGGGADTLKGGLGNDIYVIDALDIVVELAGQGTADEIRTTLASYSLVALPNVERLTGKLTTGQTLTGNAAANVITGSGGADTIDGGAGADRMVGGRGDDSYFVDTWTASTTTADDVVVELAGAGTDTVRSLVSFTLSANVENLILTGGGNSGGTGNAVANFLTGNGGANRLDGKEGADTMRGGAGNDTYVVDVWTSSTATPRDNVIESATGGVDTVESSVSYVLGANVENLVLTGANPGGATGNALANSLTGNSAANRLNGKEGADTMAGGAGNDIYVVDTWTASEAAARDTVVELAGGGTDTVESAVSYVLPAYVERLLLTGTAAIGGTGNGAANILTGNAAANILAGSSGADRLYGKDGKDILTGGSGADAFYFDTDPNRTTNFDKILDFNQAEDMIWLDQDVFIVGFSGTDLALHPTFFHAGTRAVDGADLILYDQATGRIFYDPDAVGPAAPILFAVVTAGLPLTAADFSVVPFSPPI